MIVLMRAIERRSTRMRAGLAMLWKNEDLVPTSFWTECAGKRNESVKVN